MSQPADERKDQWAEWLTRRRDGGNERARDLTNTMLTDVRDQVLQYAAIAPGDVLLDVGTGTGLIGLEALDRVGEEGKVIFSDISEDCLAHCRNIVEERGAGERSRFVRTGGEELEGIDDASVDVVTTRSVIIYIAEKQRTFDQFFRVLKPGGRLSMFEPINSFATELNTTLFRGYDVAPIQELADRVRAEQKRGQSEVERTMLDFNERDLMAFAERAGFFQIRLLMDAFTGSVNEMNWEHFYCTAPNPLAPTLEEAVNRALTESEAAAFVEYMRPLVEEGRKKTRRALAYLHAVKE